ncbi:hypothetical protein Dxin01_00805 [Deinococcus xinjiangensis]|uniref:PRTRC system protein C n=1 Tax=Deinococcus xinjiangensis TaxID=457454 RepID=A0ABP9V722_9DEIO
MEIQRTVRKFKGIGINGDQVMDDPMPSGSVEDARRLLAVSHPKLTNAAIEGPEMQPDGTQLYTLRPAVGTKG